MFLSKSWTWGVLDPAGRLQPQDTLRKTMPSCSVLAEETKLNQAHHVIETIVHDVGRKGCHLGTRLICYISSLLLHRLTYTDLPSCSQVFSQSCSTTHIRSYRFSCFKCTTQRCRSSLRSSSYMCHPTGTRYILRQRFSISSIPVLIPSEV